jgi:hypothetical protein
MRKLLAVLYLLALCALVGAHPLDTLQPGTWMEIPNTKMKTVLFPYQPGVQHGSGYPIGPWSGAVYDTNRDRFVVFGGGHSDSADNALYSFDMNTLQWSRLNDPSIRTDTANVLLTTGFYPDVHGNPDPQQPRSGHSYIPKTVAI